ncbi:MAG: hypothetical protein V4616_10700 [Bacteroidota bacterium]
MKKLILLLALIFGSVLSFAQDIQMVQMVPPAQWQPYANAKYQIKLPSPPMVVDSLGLSYVGSTTSDELIALSAYTFDNADFQFQPEFTEVLGAIGDESLTEMIEMSLIGLFEDNTIISVTNVVNSGISGKEYAVRSYNPEVDKYELHFIQSFSGNNALKFFSVHGFEENVYLIEGYKTEFFNTLQLTQ